ncbi:lysophospholipid acyltransferase 5-like [Hydractinia symbiolongicarpus]|uniref:lysophospholipid acyltransferase 5-like n=1 Tax=Hydractinia symbiolongicarpus TaxID=13093 RepID=UPI00254EF34E|nr:lysophospholipid acyltransferase 5-like [Hydractinia symbiolongicarpus]
MELNIEDFNRQINSALVGGKRGFEFIDVDVLAKMIGASEVALRFLIGVFAGFPLAFIYLYMSNLSVYRKHVYFIFTGVLINYFCFGSDFVYNLFSILVSYASIAWFGGTIYNVIFAFVFNTIYLLAGYILNASDGYDVKWTTPQCILCMRLIGLTWDIYDGIKKKEQLSSDQIDHCIEVKPTLIEIFGFSYCFCGFLGGPQFSFKRYLKFVQNSLVDDEALDQISTRYFESAKRFLAAFCVMIMYAVFDPYYRCDDQLTAEFLDKPFLWKVLQMGLIYYVQFSKYVIVWWFCESICILIGLSYEGVDKNGCAKWNGLRNFKLRQFIFGPFFQDIIESFNINTNQWAGRYLFRRLKFLNNKTLSHVLTLLYLSVWHGFYVGYFIMFTMEFLSVIAERQLCFACRNMFGMTFSELPLLLRIPVHVFGAVFKFLSCGFFVQSFMLLRWRRIKVVYSSVYYWPVIVLLTCIVVIVPTLTLLTKKLKRKQDKKNE